MIDSSKYIPAITRHSMIYNIMMMNLLCAYIVAFVELGIGEVSCLYYSNYREGADPDGYYESADVRGEPVV
jgi:hypothetical protein